MTKVVFVQPFEVNAELAMQLEGRVVVLDIAFCADTPHSTFATTTLPFIQTLGERLVLWVDHHEHERHADFTNDPRFILASRKEHPAVPEMITPELVQKAGRVDTIVAHGDFDGVIAAAKWLLGGEEPYPGADADARAADSRIGTMTQIGQMIDRALKLDLTDDTFRHTLLGYLSSRCQDQKAEAEIQQRADSYKTVFERTAYWAQCYKVDGPLAIVDIRGETERLDLTELLLAGQRLAPIAIVRNRNLKTGEPQITIAAATDSKYNFVQLFNLKGGMPTRVTLPDERFWEAIVKLKSNPQPSGIQPPCFILYADVDRIKDYLFASVRLRHIVAASGLLTQVNEEETNWLVRAHEGKLIFSAGGITQAVFADEAKARQAAQELRKLYAERTASASVTVSVVPWKVGQSFAEAIDDARRDMSVRKAGMLEEKEQEEDQKIAASTEEWALFLSFNGSPFFRICEVTGREFAVGWKQFHAGEPRTNYGLTIQATERWRESQQKKELCFLSGKKGIFDPDLGDRLPVDTSIRYRLANELGCSPGKLSFPVDFDDLSKGAIPHGYIGFMEADGNRFGELLKALRKGLEEKKEEKKSEEELEAYKTFSDLLKEATQQALEEAAVEVLKRDLQERLKVLQGRDDKVSIPLRVLLLGGDDVLLVTQAQYALPLADMFCRRFQEIAFRKLQEKEILKNLSLPEFTMSAGVVIAHHNLPFLSLHRMAAELLKSAKRRSWQAWQTQKDGRRRWEAGAVDFQVVTGTNIEDLKTVRREVYTAQDGSEELLLTGRPYLVSPENDELCRLLKAVAELQERKVPRSQLKQIPEIARLGLERGQMVFAKWFLRLGGEEENDVKKAIRKVFQEVLGAKEHIPSLWHKDNRPGVSGKWFTPLIDAVELFDLGLTRGR